MFIQGDSNILFTKVDKNTFTNEKLLHQMLDSIGVDIKELPVDSCASKLERYVDFLHKKIKQKKAQAPTFFKENSTVLSAVNTKLSAALKIIMLLKYDNYISLTEKEKLAIENKIILNQALASVNQQVSTQRVMTKLGKLYTGQSR